jgi:hypothetical protein
MELKVIEAASHEEVDKQVTDINNKAWEQYTKSSFSGHLPHYDKKIVSDIATSGAVRAVVYEKPCCCHSHMGSPADLGEVRNPFGVLGGGV